MLSSLRWPSRSWHARRFLPPSQVFWGYATGAAQIAAATAILTRVCSRLAAYLLTVMYAAFTPLVHLPMLTAAPHDHYVWSENALNLALVGAAWVVADTTAGDPGRRRSKLYSKLSNTNHADPPA